jgi:hypothetical protein
MERILGAEVRTQVNVICEAVKGGVIQITASNALFIRVEDV